MPPHVAQLVAPQGIVQQAGHVNLNAGPGPNISINGLGAGGPPPSFSMLEYNISRLASLTETMPDSLNDAMAVGGGAPGPVPNVAQVPGGSVAVAGGAVVGAPHPHQQQQQAVMPASAVTPTQPITLADILSGDQRALNNLQALAKLGLNNNGEC